MEDHFEMNCEKDCEKGRKWVGGMGAGNEWERLKLWSVGALQTLCVERYNLGEIQSVRMCKR